MKELIKNNIQKLKFAIIGGINTLIDFSIFLILTAAGFNVVFANIISTTVALNFSFFANKKYTFQISSNNLKREVLLFLIVTLFGLWVLQPVAIVVILTLLEPFNLKEILALTLAKLIATVVSLTWNYVLYSKIVFKKPD